MNKLPLPEKAEITDSVVDSVLAINAAAGYVIWLIDELERKHKVFYKQSIKQRGNLFRDELLNSVNQVWLKGGAFDAEEIGKQQMDTYIMAEQMFKLALEVSRRLSPEKAEKFQFSFQNLLYGFGLDVPQV